MSKKEAEEILRNLHGEIWTGNRTSHLVLGACIQPGKHFVNPDKIRNLSTKEIDSVFALAEKHDFPATISQRFGGASFCLRIYPDLVNPNERLDRLITIESSQFPGNEGRAMDETVYEQMSRLVERPRNKELILKCGIKKPLEYSACRF